MSVSEAFLKQSYYLARNEKRYLEDQSFNSRVSALIAEIPKEQMDEYVHALEQMIGYKELYFEVEKEYAPILIYISDNICYGILNYFAKCLGDALEKEGQLVEYFDTESQSLEELVEKAKQPYKAIVGIQTYLFSVKFVSGKPIHDVFDAPLFNMVLDHPLVMHKHLLDATKQLTILTHDRNYEAYIKRYYPNVNTEIFYPAGEEWQAEEKIYDLTFVGSYADWTPWREPIRGLNRKYRGKIRTLITEMKRNPNQTYEQSCRQVFNEELKGLSKEEEAQLLFECKDCYFLVMKYYRKKIIFTILNAGIKLQVFGDCWRNAAFQGYPNLQVHEQMTQQECLRAYAQSRISLNIMSWHKDGMTERLANMMLCNTVVLSDRSTYLEEHYKNHEELELFDLTEIEKLPNTIRKLLRDEQKQYAMTQKAYEKASLEHRWEHRAKQLLTLL